MENTILLTGPFLMSLLWAFALAAIFLSTYALFVIEHKDRKSSRSRTILTGMIGTLLVLGTYVDLLASKPFGFNHCLLFALVAAQGWMAEDFVRNFMNRAHAVRPTPQPH